MRFAERLIRTGSLVALEHDAGGVRDVWRNAGFA